MERAGVDRGREWERKHALACEQLEMSRQRRQQLMLRMHDTRRWARSMLERIYSLDGERVHPHPGMSPETAPQRRTASELTQSGKWETIERDGEKHISYTHDTHVDQRFHTAAVIFPGGTTGIGLFADREFQRGEYITAWMGTPANETSQTTAELER